MTRSTNLPPIRFAPETLEDPERDWPALVLECLSSALTQQDRIEAANSQHYGKQGKQHAKRQPQRP
jgi:hypothetical protein